LLGEAYETASADRDADGDVPEDGNLAVLAGAYVGEVLLAAFGGQWLGPPAFRLSVGDRHQLDVGVLGKVRKFLQNGPEDAVHPLAQVVASRV
jgi:hypothetical protein